MLVNLILEGALRGSDKNTCVDRGWIMSFIKTMLVLGATVWLLPTDKESQARLFQTAANGVERVVTFCDRNPATCTKTAEYWALFKAKAQFGIESAWTLATERGKATSTASMPAPTPATSASTAPPAVAQNPRSAAPIQTRRVVTQPTPPRGTLTESDTRHAFRGRTASLN